MRNKKSRYLLISICNNGTGYSRSRKQLGKDT